MFQWAEGNGTWAILRLNTEEQANLVLQALPKAGYPYVRKARDPSTDVKLVFLLTFLDNHFYQGKKDPSFTFLPSLASIDCPLKENHDRKKCPFHHPAKKLLCKSFNAGNASRT